VAGTLYLSDDVVVREKVYDLKGKLKTETIISSETGQPETRPAEPGVYTLPVHTIIPQPYEVLISSPGEIQLTVRRNDE